MDYEQMTTPELQAECKRRGLPSGRVKNELVQRLTEADGHEASTVTLTDGEQVPRPDVTIDARPDLLPPQPEPFEPHEPAPATASTFRATWQPGPGGLDEATHATFRQQTRDAATAAGHSPRGDAYRVGTADDGEVYEVNVRRRP